jgi:hypothetical protein
MVWKRLLCRHAGPSVENGLRSCFHPQLRGLKIVGPDQCGRCWYRNAPVAHGSVATDGTSPREWDCAWLGTNGVERPEPTGPVPAALDDPSLWLDRPCACHHPARQWTTRRQCVICPDYLFPFLSPHMPTDMALQHLRRPRRPQPDGWWTWPNVQQAFRRLTDEAIDKIDAYPGRCAGQGLVIVGGGKYFPSAYVTIRVLRHVGCSLPVQLWHLTGEITDWERDLLRPWDVQCVDGEARAAETGFPLHATWWKGWQLKPYAIQQSPFREVLFLDADCYPTRDPEFLFREQGFRERGAIFWPDLDSSACLLTPDRTGVFGVSPFPDLPTESGQLLINKELCWRELSLALFYNARADFTYRLLWGDKDTFPIAWRRLGREYARLWPTARSTQPAILQHDGQGQVLFQHRATDKFRFAGTQFDANPQGRPANERYPALAHEDFCFAVLGELAAAHRG